MFIATPRLCSPAPHWVLRDASRALFSAGSSMLMRTAMMPMTTSNSTSVNARRVRVRIRIPTFPAVATARNDGPRDAGGAIWSPAEGTDATGRAAKGSMTQTKFLDLRDGFPAARRIGHASAVAVSRWLPLFVLGMLALPARAEDAPAPYPRPVADLKRDTPVSFEKEILPILSTNCLACHNRTKAKADLVLETPTDILKGGESGPAVVAKKAEESLLLKVSAHRVEPVMPPKGNKVAAADLNPEQLGLVKLWIDQGATGSIGGASVPTVELRDVPAGLKAIYAAAVTPDGQYAACSRGSEVHVYHLPTGTLVAQLSGHRDLVQSLAFSPDGMLLASGGYRQVIVWKRPRDVKQFSITSAHRGAIHAGDVSPDGTMFATAGADGAVRIWGTGDGRPLKE